MRKRRKRLKTRKEEDKGTRSCRLAGEKEKEEAEDEERRGQGDEVVPIGR